MSIKSERSVTDTTWQKHKILRRVSLQYGLCPIGKDDEAMFPFTTPGLEIELYAQKCLHALGWLHLIDATRNDAETSIYFDLSSQDPMRMMVKPGKVPPYGDTFYE